jgi:hypothetical protein
LKIWQQITATFRASTRRLLDCGDRLLNCPSTQLRVHLFAASAGPIFPATPAESSSDSYALGVSDRGELALSANAFGVVDLSAQRRAKHTTESHHFAPAYGSHQPRWSERTSSQRRERPQRGRDGLSRLRSDHNVVPSIGQMPFTKLARDGLSIDDAYRSLL